MTSSSLGVGGGARVTREGPLLGAIDLLALDVGARNAWSSTSVPFRQLELELRAGVGHHFDRGRLAAWVGLEAGAIAVWQWQVPTLGSRFGIEPTLVALLGGRVRVTGPLHAFAAAQGGAALVNQLKGLQLVPRALGTVGLALEL